MMCEPYKPMTPEQREVCEAVADSRAKRKHVRALVLAAERLMGAVQYGACEHEISEATDELEEILEETEPFNAILDLMRDGILTSVDVLEDELGTLEPSA